jgi:hypothetical protein
MTGAYFARKPVGHLRGAADLRGKAKGTFHRHQAINEPLFLATNYLYGDMMTLLGRFKRPTAVRLAGPARTSLPISLS